ncbi:MULTISPECIES: CdiA family toxin C-terminal domain-containing protein [Priestia]|uniref:CdiA family toxin C-terminal domain-containing protein n=1 Tax=Priestia TaxID=2800373 RepID=UPI0021ADF2AC|nr:MULTISPECIES: CdiA family toxin C-terminal domain-containing protein [Priestia]MCZ8496752.1 CdiA family toxin C-terminal domain-containing protein [Priestia megaterium]UYV50724.1 CdiA family toxin C-terminal domain-containing protein [Priestia megaterium]
MLKVQRDLAALSHSKAKLEKELKKYPYLYANYKKSEIARSAYETEAKKQQQDGLAAVSFVADMVPVVSNVKSGWEASVGSDPKTVYDPSKISDDKIYRLGQEAMQNGKVNGRLVEGTASNGLEFRGYLNEAGEITNFFPIVD